MTEGLTLLPGIHRADSLCWTAETNTKQLYFNKNQFKNKASLSSYEAYSVVGQI